MSFHYLDLRRFFDDYQNQLAHHHPGITLAHIKREFDFIQAKSANFYLGSAAQASALQKLASGIPLAYISRRAFFYRAEFYVDERVLIPRPETELLVSHCCQFLENLENNKLNKLNELNELVVVDVGTGQGAIALSLRQNVQKNLTIYATDLSTAALKVAKINAYRLTWAKAKAKEKLYWRQGDRLTGLPLPPASVDLVVSNPPYIKRQADALSTHHQVKKYEPHLALFLDDSSYDQWYAIFFSQALNLLRPGGAFLMEGHERHLRHLAALALKVGLKGVEIRQDYGGKDRYLLAQKKVKGRENG